MSWPDINDQLCTATVCWLPAMQNIAQPELKVAYQCGVELEVVSAKLYCDADACQYGHIPLVLIIWWRIFLHKSSTAPCRTCRISNLHKCCQHANVTKQSASTCTGPLSSKTGLLQCTLAGATAMRHTAKWHAQGLAP